MKKMSRLALLVVALFTVGLLPASTAQATGGTCQIWCDNGITVEGWNPSFQSCQDAFVANYSQYGWYGGRFCYSGDEEPGCWTW
jgi:hypothetical protein